MKGLGLGLGWLSLQSNKRDVSTVDDDDDDDDNDAIDDDDDDDDMMRWWDDEMIPVIEV